MKNVTKHRDIELATTKIRSNNLVSEPNYHIKKFLTENLLAIEMKKTDRLMNTPVYLELSILELSKTLTYEFWYDYVKPKYGEKVKLCYMNTDSFIAYIKADDIYKDIADDVETRFGTSNYKLEGKSIKKPLPKGKNKKVIGLMKDKISRQIMKEFVGLRTKTYSYLKDSNDEDKKTKDTKRCIIKRELKCQNYKNCSEAAQIDRKINYLKNKRNLMWIVLKKIKENL